MSQTMAELFRRISSGVYVIGVSDAERHNAFTAAWVMPVSFQPLLLAVSICPKHSSYRLLMDGRGFSVNVLREDQIELAAHFGKPIMVDKMATAAWHAGKKGFPLLDDVLAYFECVLTAEYPAGDHRLMLGRVIDGALLHAGAKPLYYKDTGDMDGAAVLYPDDFDLT